MNKRKRRTLFAALASVVFLTVCTSAYLNYGFNRDVVATPEDFDISMEVLEMPGNENGGKVKVKCRLQNATPWPLRISYGGTVFYPFVYSPEVPRPEPHRSTTMVVTDMPVLFPGQSITETHEIGPGDWDFYADGWGTDRGLGCYALFSGWPFEKFMDNHPLPELKESKVDLEDVPIPQP